MHPVIRTMPNCTTIYSAHRASSRGFITFSVSFKFAPKVRPTENRLFTGILEKDETYTIRIYLLARLKWFTIGNQKSLAKVSQKFAWKYEKSQELAKMLKMDKKVKSNYNSWTNEATLVSILLWLGKGHQAESIDDNLVATAPSFEFVRNGHFPSEKRNCWISHRTAANRAKLWKASKFSSSLSQPKQCLNCKPADFY